MPKPIDTKLMRSHTNQIAPDVHGLLLLAGSWSPVLLVAFRYETLALLLSMIVAVLAIVDYSLKIWWKVKQVRERKRDNHMLLDDEQDWFREHESHRDC